MGAVCCLLSSPAAQKHSCHVRHLGFLGYDFETIQGKGKVCAPECEYNVTEHIFPEINDSNFLPQILIMRQGELNFNNTTSGRKM